MNTLKLITASLVLVSTVAVAQRGYYTATLAQPLTGSKEIVANDNLWYCSGSTCKLVSQPKNPLSHDSCRTLQQKVGPLSAYGGQDNSFDADKLAKCNAGR